MAEVGDEEAGAYWAAVRSWDGQFALEVQPPWSRKLVSGEKSVETREYPFPPALRGRTVLLLESQEGQAGRTPVPSQVQEAHPGLKVIGSVVFSATVKYTSQAQWDADLAHHLVPAANPYSFANKPQGTLYGWKVAKATAFCLEVRVPAMVRVVRSIFRVTASAGGGEEVWDPANPPPSPRARGDGAAGSAGVAVPKGAVAPVVPVAARSRVQPPMVESTQLPLDVLEVVFSFLTPHDVLQAALVCKHWLVAADSGPLWLNRCVYTFGHDSVRALLHRHTTPKRMFWKCPRLRYDGVYVAQGRFVRVLRFCANGTVLSVSTSSLNLARMASWFYEGNTDVNIPRGVVTAHLQTVHFTVSSEAGVVEYSGTAAFDHVVLSSQSHINGNRLEGVRYSFVPFPEE